MTSDEMKQRTKAFAINVAKLTQKLPDNTINRAYCGQIIRSSSSVGANYRASRRAKSNADFINKLKIVEEELDESLFFLELLVAFNEKFRDEIAILYKEGESILKIIVASIKSSRK
ncbi:four helix bundle protein [Ferruginibacter sp.]|jgi:four helix bundle protein|nr:four helix bundle protein [Ferruginibacter sp.]